ncbi:MAG: 16S rRNA (adenine(1518)-N(6)/adenine(1519)-N(6))-dimethyltransferase RsmA [Clostridia bacterium]|nr:16S rRNA (adenine(1518)-N(6)/adenine(1519)-N(6))-dimethyltransferase RsmA [Clostridia bacterium]
MYDLTSPSVIRHLCDEFGFSFKKGFGQNFLTDADVLLSIAEAAGSEGVLEIGPGFGTLTAVLGNRAKKVVSIEIDRTLEPVLKTTLAGFDNIKIHFADVMKTDLEKLINEEFPGMSLSVAANLPYYVTSPILMKLLEEKLPFENIVVMVQKEVAERIVAKPGTKDYGALTLAVSYYADAEIITTVPAESFVPAPKVDSAVVSMKLLKEPPIDAPEKDYFRLVKASFAQRRKTMLNALSNAGFYGSKDDIKAVLESLGYDSNLRGETLSMKEFSEIAKRFTK